MAAGERRAMASGQLRRRAAEDRPGRPPPRPGRRSDLGGRIIVAAPALALGGLVVWRGGAIFAALLVVLGWICLDELYRMTSRASPARLAGFAALLALIAAAYWGERDQVLLVAIAALPVTFLVTLASPRGSAYGIAVTMLGVWWIGLAMAHAVMLQALPHGGGIITDVLVGTFVGDTGAYLGGRSFGRRRLAPAISPSKTVEGLIIGMICAVAGVWFASLYQGWLPKGDALLLGLGVAVAAPIGDLFESYLKRRSGCEGHRPHVRRARWRPRPSRRRDVRSRDRVLRVARDTGQSMKRIAILGSTGSIGEQAIDVVSRTEGLEVVALSAHSNWERVVAQARSLGVGRIALADPQAAASAAGAWPDGEVLAGPIGVIELITGSGADLVLNAIVGSARSRARRSSRSARGSTWRSPTRSRSSPEASS